MAFPLMLLASISCLSFFLPVTDIQNIPQWSLRTFTSVSGFLYFLSFPIILTDHTIHILDSSNTLAICLFYLNSGILHLYSKPFHLAVVWRPCHLLEPVISDTYFFFFSFHPIFTEDNETDSSCTLKKKFLLSLRLVPLLPFSLETVSTVPPCSYLYLSKGSWI